MKDVKVSSTGIAVAAVKHGSYSQRHEAIAINYCAVQLLAARDDRQCYVSFSIARSA